MLSSGKDITVCAAFALARGGVSIYFENSEDRDKALKKLPKESFGGGSKKTLSPTKKRNLYLKGIDTAVSESVIADTLQRLTGEEVKCIRLLSRTTGRPRQAVRINCTKEVVDKILESHILVGDSKVTAELPRHQNIVRCFNCQNFGHVAINCTRDTRCELCSKTSCGSSCGNEIICANCSGNHPAYDPTCPIFIRKNEDITS